MFDDGKAAHFLLSEEGIHQGDALVPALFSESLHSFLLDLQENHSSIQVLAYLDDMFLIGRLDGVLSSLNDVSSGL